jgi:hypothetical protein
MTLRSKPAMKLHMHEDMTQATKKVVTMVSVMGRGILGI